MEESPAVACQIRRLDLGRTLDGDAVSYKQYIVAAVPGKLGVQLC
jgi:hypothetical protein